MNTNLNTSNNSTAEFINENVENNESSSSSSSFLERCSPEILREISKHLDAKSFCRLAQTCSTLYERLDFGAFADAYSKQNSDASELQKDNSREYLQRCIANHGYPLINPSYKQSIKLVGKIAANTQINDKPEFIDEKSMPGERLQQIVQLKNGKLAIISNMIYQHPPGHLYILELNGFELKTLPEAAIKSPGRITSLNNYNVIAASRDDQLDIWDCSQTDPIHKQILFDVRHDPSRYDLPLIKSGLFLTTTSHNQIIVFKQNESGVFEKIKRLSGHEFSIREIIDIKDDVIASCSQDGTIKIWNLKNEQNNIDPSKILSPPEVAKKDFQQHEFGGMIKLETEDILTWITEVSIDKDSSHCNDILIWDLKSDESECIRMLSSGYKNGVKRVMELTNKSLVSWGRFDKDCDLKIWDLKKESGKECVKVLKGHKKRVNKVGELPNGFLISASNDKTLKIWNLEKSKGKECVHTLKCDGAVNGFIQLRDYRLVSFENETIKVWDLYNNGSDNITASDKTLA